MEPSNQSQQTVPSLSVETQLALINQTMKQTDEKIGNIIRSLDKLAENAIGKATFDNLVIRVDALEKRVDTFESRYETHMQDYVVMKNDAGTVKKLVYSAVGVLLTLVLVAIGSLVIISRK